MAFARDRLRWCIAGIILLQAALALSASAPAATLSAGVAHTLATRSDGAGLAWGRDGRGELGRGEVVQSPVPQAIAAIPGISSVAAGDVFAVALARTGQVYAWGENTYGQLGDGTREGRPDPAPVSGLADVVSIAAASDVGIAVRRDGSVWTWGAWFDSAIGRAVGVAEDTATPARIPNLAGVASVVASPYHVLALLDDGTVWSWGSNYTGQLGNGTTNDGITPAQVPGLAGMVAVAASATFSMALRSDGTVWAWGRNADGQLGDGSRTDRLTPVAVAGLAPVRAIAAEFSTSVAVDSSGAVWSWGSNAFGLLGIGPTPTFVSDRTRPGLVPALSGAVEASGGTFHFLVRLQSGKVMAWGSNEYGQIGDGTNEDRRAPVEVSGISSASRVFAGDGVSFAVLGDGGLLGWGDNRGGMLASPRTARNAVARAVLSLGPVKAVSGGYQYSLALANDGSVWGWGRNADGQLGDGTRTARSTPTQASRLSNMVDVSAGSSVSAAVGGDGAVWAWGFLIGAAFQTDESGALITGLTPVRLVGFSDIARVSAGGNHLLALKRDGTVWAYGANSAGQLGLGNMDSMSRIGRQVPGLSGIVSIAAGDERSFAVGSDGTVWAWGSGRAFASDATPLGNNSPADQPSPIRVPGVEGAIAVSTSSLGNHALALLRDGTVRAWGDNWRGQLGDGTTTDRGTPVASSGLSGVVEISAGSDHSVARLAGGSVVGWGYNYSGAVGDGTFADRSTARATAGIDGVGLLDLSPENAAGLPPALVPPFGVVTRSKGPDGAPIVDATLSYNPSDIGSTRSVYVFALAPADIVKAAADGSPPFKVGRAVSRDGSKADVACVLAQPNASGQLQAVSAEQLQAYLSGVLSAVGQTVPVVSGASSASVGGATFYVGYGTSSSAMIGGGINRSVVTVPGARECTPQAPQTGWWWNPKEDGRGFSLEVRGNNIFFAAFLYDVSGRSTWYVSTGPVSLDGSLYRGDLLAARGGQTLGGAYPGFPALASVGPISMTFDSASQGTIMWPGGTVPIERFNIVPNGLGLAPVAGQPESGWWWNEEEAGRGFFLEWQGGNLDIAGYLYDDAGNSVWYLTTGTIGGATAARSFAGNWWSFGGGQTLTGAWKPNARLSDNVAPVTIQFGGADTAIMTLPNGRTTSLKRHRF